MRLLNATLRPARVIEVLDSAGNIRVEAPGLFSREDQENLPPVMPWPWAHCNAFSSVKELDEVWVLNVSDNPLQLFWFRKDDRTEHNTDIESEENVEILCNRPTGTGYATIYFSDGTGWMFRNTDSFLQINPDGEIILDTGNSKRAISITEDSISLGTVGGSAHQGCYGDEVQKCLEKIQGCLVSIREAAKGNAYTMPIAAALGSSPDQLKTAIPKVVSQNVTLD